MKLSNWLATVFSLILAYGMYLQIAAVPVIMYTIMSIAAFLFAVCLVAFDEVKASLYKTFKSKSGLSWLVSWITTGLWFYVAYLIGNTTFIYFYAVYLFIFYTLVIKTLIQGNKQ